MRGPTTGLPSGTVTFVFTDIEGSTRLVQGLGDRYRTVLADHRQIIRHSISSHDGIEVGTEGDSFFVVFRSARDAIAAAAEIQQALADHDWPQDGDVKVRIGLHTGQGWVEAGDYVGLDVHRAARIASAGYGGQVVVSESTAVSLASALPDGLGLLDLGKHRLKDLTEPETLYQLEIPGLRSEFPLLKTLDATPNNLPIQLTSFVGRQEVMAQALDLFATTRILTLTGPGGTGKTRLSLQMAAELSDTFDDGVFFVELAPVSSPDLVASAVLDAVGLASTSSERTPEEFLVDQIADRSALVVLDNFEHVVAAAPMVSRLAQASPDSKFLVSSRVPLAIGGEQELEVPPLSTADAETKSDLSDLMKVEGVRLFVERAASVRPDFELNTDNSFAVAELVDRLDGLPLAIELVASQVKLLAPEKVLERLDVKTLGSRRRDLPERQATLWGAIEWSYELLDEPDRLLFSRLSVFAGGAQLEEIEEVCHRGLDADLMSSLGRLVDHSLVRSSVDSEARFQMLHVIREFAATCLEEGGEAEEIRRSHASAYTALAEKVRPELLKKDRKLWLDRLSEDMDNIRAALSWSIESQETDLAARLAFDTWRFWQARGYLYEAESRISEILDLPEQSLYWRAKALETAGGVAWWRGDLDSSKEKYRRALEIHRQGNDPNEIANALYNLGLALPNYQAGSIENTTGLDESDRARIAEAHEMLAEARDIYFDLGDVGGLADVVWGQGQLNLNAKDLKGYHKDSSEAIDLYRRAGNEFGMGWAMFETGWALYYLGDVEKSEDVFRQGLELFGDHGDVSAVVLYLSALASILKDKGDITRALTLAGAMHGLRLQSGSDIASLDIIVRDGLEFETLEGLTGDLAAAYRKGRGICPACGVIWPTSFSRLSITLLERDQRFG